MSVQADGGDDALYFDGGGVAIGIDTYTTAFTLCGWLKVIAESGERDIVNLATTTSGPPLFGVLYNGAGGDNLSWWSESSATTVTGYNVATGTWYYVVASRNTSGTLRVRVFADSTSTSALSDLTAGPDASYGTTLDCVVFGSREVGSRSAENMELEAWRLFVGTELTNTQCRDESLRYDGFAAVPWANWRMRRTDADVNGINDSSGNGRHLTNAGFVNGTSSPAMLWSRPSIPPSGMRQAVHRAAYY